MTDTLIIGAGPAGLTAAIYLRRAGWTVTVLDKLFYGGQVAITPEVENYPGVLKIAGPDLSENMYRQAADLGADIRFEDVKEIFLEGEIKRVVTSSGTYEGKTVILANGAKRRKLGCPGEEEFAGKGVSYCATCDGAFFKEKDVAIVGGGNTALEDALYLANTCRRVTLIHRRDTFRGEKKLAQAVLRHQNIQVTYSSAVVSVQGEQSVTGIEVKDLQTEAVRLLPVSALFIAIGYEPENQLFSPPVRLDEQGYILAGEDCLTNIPGVFAAGDSRVKLLRQIVTATADGAVAAYQAGVVLSEQE